MVRLILLVPLSITLAMGYGQEQVTWSGQIACIIYSHCTPCHHTSGIAPFSLESYDDAYRYRYGIEPVIARRDMPPWPPANGYGDLAGARVLTDEEIGLFRQWVEEGALKGDPDEAPDPPTFTTLLEIPDPDFSVRLPAFEIPDARELDLYRCFVIPTSETEDRFITGIEIVPGNRSVVHHVILFQDTTGTAEAMDAADPALGYTCFGGIGTNDASMVSGWVPGASAYFTPENMGIFLPKGATLVAQIHYPEGSVGQVDSTLINLQFSNRNDLRPIVNLPALNHFSGIDRPLFIPANTRQTFKETFFPVPFDVIVTGIAPHAHLICESMKAFATTPQGETIPLIDIPHWNFEWQGFYRFKKPVVIPAFSTLHGVATYNNTTSNPHLPGDVPVDVSVGEATTDEMMVFFLSFSIYQAGDEHLILDTASHQSHHQDCQVDELILPVRNIGHQARLTVAPNPAQNYLHVTLEGSTSENQRLELTDLWGRKIQVLEITGRSMQIDLPSALTSGIYYYRSWSKATGPSPWQKLIIAR